MEIPTILTEEPVEEVPQAVQGSPTEPGFKFVSKPELLRAIVECGFEHPSEVLIECIPQAFLGTVGNAYDGRISNSTEVQAEPKLVAQVSSRWRLKSTPWADVKDVDADGIEHQCDNPAAGRGSSRRARRRRQLQQRLAGAEQAEPPPAAAGGAPEVAGAGVADLIKAARLAVGRAEQAAVAVAAAEAAALAGGWAPARQLALAVAAHRRAVLDCDARLDLAAQAVPGAVDTGG